MLLPPHAPFLAATPVWPIGFRARRNTGIGFSAEVNLPEGTGLKLRLAATNTYRAWINGRFFAYGPARAPHGHLRVDEWPMDAFAGTRVRIAIEVVAYRVNAFSVLDEPGQLTAEIETQAGALVWTSPERGDFTARLLDHRVQRLVRYSYQRTFIECYSGGSECDAWREKRDAAPSLPLEAAEPSILLPRRMPLPDFPLHDLRRIGGGFMAPRTEPYERYRARFTHELAPALRGFQPSEWDVDPPGAWQGYTFVQDESDSLAAPRFADYRLEGLQSGFIRIELTCHAPARILIGWSERLVDGQLDIFRLETNDLAQWDLPVGTHTLETFESYTLGFLRIAVLSGEILVRTVNLRGYEAPARLETFHADPDLAAIQAAALATFRQNAVEVFMDCPSRERAGWLADSFYIGRSAHTLAYPIEAETAFLENYLLAPACLNGLPEGMLPMCYPSDHDAGDFIPQWTLWLVLQIHEYARRGGAAWLIRDFEPHLRKLFGWFDRHLNAEGLLERLGGWNFVEWSKANDFVQDVNFPTNWLYAAALDAFATLYHDPAAAARATDIREAATRLSWQGEFFADRALRGEDGALVVTADFTEICQYSAFILGAATRDSHPGLWSRLVTEFGPLRQAGAHPQVHPANMLYGWVMRWELLKAVGEHRRMQEEMKALLLPMARDTGTLWEHDSPTASCCHGFTACALWLLADGKTTLPWGAMPVTPQQE
jgi:alpha-L-rhamnosidase